MSPSEILLAWLPQQAASAAAKISPCGNELLVPLSSDEKAALALMADCDIDEIPAAGGSGTHYRIRHALTITVNGGRFSVREFPNAEFSET